MVDKLLAESLDMVNGARVPDAAARFGRATGSATACSPASWP